VLIRSIENDYKVFADTNAFMAKISVKVFSELAAVLQINKKKLYVPKSVINEIKNQSKTYRGKQANKILEDFKKYDLLRIETKFDEKYADDPIQALFLSLRLKYNLCLITNDNSKFKDGNLAQDILDLKRSRSTDFIKDIKVFSFDSQRIYEFKDRYEIENEMESTMENKKEKTTSKRRKKFQFNLHKNPKLNDVQLNPSNIPTTGNIVIDNKGVKHKLLKQIGRTGGEGSVYLTNTKFICKIYKKEKVTKFREEKIKLLISHAIKIPNVCLPEFIVHNSKKEFVGYLMQEASGGELKTSVFIPPLLKQKFPTWDRSHLVKIAINILKKVEKLHSYNIILGDINPSNILIKDENTIYFIDTDSFQIENYPCSVGMVPYTRKIHHRKRYENYLRTKDDDIYAVSTLLFQLMLPGKLPYSFSGGGSEKENMKPENFPYKCYDGTGYNNAPDGQWVYIWSHLPKKLKILFCKIFKKNEQVALFEIITEIKAYSAQLKKGWQSKEIFPLTHKQIDADGNVLIDDFKTFLCTRCGQEFAIPNSKVKDFKAKGWSLQKKCKICSTLKDPDLKQCTSCGKSFKDKNSNVCKHCRGENIKCSNCNSIFFFSDSEKTFYDKKGLNYPKNCKVCRDKKRQQPEKKSGGFFSWFGF
jgi:rRNA-processing protein FCF1/tRNA A-37 threonylcarbamoyl transferase component Bud32